MLARNLPGVVVIVSPIATWQGGSPSAGSAATSTCSTTGFSTCSSRAISTCCSPGDEDIDRPSVLPAGRLREPLDAARHADALLWTGPARDARSARRAAGAGDRLRCAPRRRAACTARRLATCGPPPGARIIAVAAIARPRPFVDGLRAAGFDVAAETDLAGSSPVHARATWTRMRAAAVIESRRERHRHDREGHGAAAAVPAAAVRGCVAAPRLAHRTRLTRSRRGLTERLREADTRAAARVGGARGMRHRLELAAVHIWCAASSRAMPGALARPCGRLLGLRVLSCSIGVHRRVADTNLAMAFPAAHGRRSGGRSRGRCSGTSAACCWSC